MLPYPNAALSVIRQWNPNTHLIQSGKYVL